MGGEDGCDGQGKYTLDCQSGNFQKYMSLATILGFTLELSRII